MAIDGVELTEHATPQEDVLREAEKWFPVHGRYTGMHGLPVLPDHRITLNAFEVPGEMDGYCADLSVVFEQETVSARLTRVRHKHLADGLVLPSGILARDDQANQIDIFHPELGLVSGYNATISTLSSLSILAAIMPDETEVELSSLSYNELVPELMAKIIICALGDDVRTGWTC